MNIPQYAKVIESTKETGFICIDKNCSSRASINGWKSYLSAKFAGISEVIICDPDITLADYDELSAMIRMAEYEIWNYKT